MKPNLLSLRSAFAAGLARLSVYLAAAPGAIKSHLNAQELVRITVAAVAAGGGVFGVLQAVVLNAGTIFPAPADAALAAAVLTLILEANRRLGHGEEPARPAARRSRFAR